MNITRVKRIKNRLIEIESRKNKQNIPANFLYLIQKEEKVEGKKGERKKERKNGSV